MITWQLFGDQFFNEKLVVQILKVGIRVGVESAMRWGEEKEIGVVVKKEEIERAIEELMDDTKEGEERRKRANEVAQMAKSANHGSAAKPSEPWLVLHQNHQKNRLTTLSTTYLPIHS
ncbi:UDP-glycosyltransferase 73C3 [Senna tora]|uniref:UDP-glycosyltransferase 73C3 n=1 Tax=Senna tora TaxID=362788 RepID=A0A834SZK9_9FABA|nr:UDP-glycosyltransferase 73C3 [Senna tora]